MGNWAAWSHAYDRLTYATDGDPLEQDCAHGTDIGTHFPNHEVFWKYHVAPATNRPVDIAHRKNVAQVMQRMMTLNYSVLADLSDAAHTLVELRRHNYGAQLSIFKSFLKSIGDAFQKHSDLVDRAIHQGIASRVNPYLPSPLRIWSDPEYAANWKPQREELVNYRHFLTHDAAHPYIIPVKQSDGTICCHAIKRTHIGRTPRLTWDQQAELFAEDPTQFTEITAISCEMYSSALAWFNDAYAVMIQKMEPLLSLDEYHQLWGWIGPYTYGMGSGSGPIVG